MEKLKFYFLLFSILNSPFAVFSADEYSRLDFPPKFIFGSATSAYQLEGAANEDGRTPSVWDTFSQGAGEIAADGYHRYKEDVKLMAETGLDAYRFSISWSRLIPEGRGEVNPKGLQYYNNLINELVSHDIEVHVSLYNYDSPQALEDEYTGWVSRRMVEDFTAYAEVCFREFGDRVKTWTTVNEPNIAAPGGYDQGITPPGRCSYPFGFNCLKGNSSYEPYLVAHHMLLAHASAVSLYRTKYQEKQNGTIGLTLYTPWLAPFTNSTEDTIAAERARDFIFGWFLKPLVYGDYPEIMKKNVLSRLPVLSYEESQLVKGAFDFIGLIHYTIYYVKDDSNNLRQETRDYNADMEAHLFTDPEYPITIITPDHNPLWPWGLQGLLEYMKLSYGNPPAYIYENGQVLPHDSGIEDTLRVDYLQAYLGTLVDAIRNGSNTRGYFVWSFLDLYELLSGYRSSFGLYFVDFDDPELTRKPKLSAKWYSHFLKGGNVSSGNAIEIDKDIHKSMSHASVLAE